jgi:hypothetical protein
MVHETELLLSNVVFPLHIIDLDSLSIDQPLNLNVSVLIFKISKCLGMQLLRKFFSPEIKGREGIEGYLTTSRFKQDIHSYSRTLYVYLYHTNSAESQLIDAFVCV